MSGAIALVALLSLFWLSISPSGRMKKRRIYLVAVALLALLGTGYYIYTAYEIYRFFHPKYEVVPSAPSR